MEYIGQNYCYGDFASAEMVTHTIIDSLDNIMTNVDIPSCACMDVYAIVHIYLCIVVTM